MRRTDFPHRPPRKSPKSDNSRFAILGFVASVIGSLVTLVVLLPLDGRLAGLQYLRSRGGGLPDAGGQHACGQERTSFAFRLESRRRIHPCRLCCRDPR